MLLAAEKLIDCTYEDFLKHFNGKKIYGDTENAVKIRWYGDKAVLEAMLVYLDEKGFVRFTDVKVYNFIIAGIPLNDIIKEHFKITESGKVSKKSFLVKLETLFPATTAYRCKTRLFYKARNKENQKTVFESIGIIV